MNAQINAGAGGGTEKEWAPSEKVLPVILSGKIPENLPAGQAGKTDKLELFEKGLEKEIRKDDTIEQALSKMVKMALCAEFGPSLVSAKGAPKMIGTILQAINADPKLRRQALIIIDRLAQ